MYHQITKDLQQAEECYYRRNRKHLLPGEFDRSLFVESRVALYIQDWEEAYAYAETWNGTTTCWLNGFDNSAAV